MADEPDRRGVLKCMGWAGTGCSGRVSGGLANSVALDTAAALRVRPFSFVQMSDSHIDFAKDPNPDARATFRAAAAQIRAPPAAGLHPAHT